MKKYITKGTSWKVEAKIEEIEVDRDSESSVWVKGRRRQKVTAHETFHDSWDDAHAHLLASAERKVENARRAFEEHKSYLGNVKGMRKPV